MTTTTTRGAQPTKPRATEAQDWTRFREIPFSVAAAFDPAMRGPHAPERFAAPRQLHRMPAL